MRFGILQQIVTQAPVVVEPSFTVDPAILNWVAAGLGQLFWWRPRTAGDESGGPLNAAWNARPGNRHNIGPTPTFTNPLGQQDGWDCAFYPLNATLSFTAATPVKVRVGIHTNNGSYRVLAVKAGGLDYQLITQGGGTDYSVNPVFATFTLPAGPHELVITNGGGDAPLFNLVLIDQLN